MIHKIQTYDLVVPDDTLLFLALEHSDLFPMTEDVVCRIASVGNSWTMESLLQLERQDVHVTQKVLEAAVGNRRAGNMINLLWPYREPDTEVNEDMLRVATSWGHGDHVTKFVANQLQPNLTLSEETILKIISESGDGVGALTTFLDHEDFRLSVSEALVENILSHDHALAMLKLLTKDRNLDFPITETMVCIAAKNRLGAIRVVNYLAELCQGPMPINENAMRDIVLNTNESEYLKVVLHEAPDTALTEQVFVAACSNETAMRVILDQKRIELPLDAMLRQFVNEQRHRGNRKRWAGLGGSTKPKCSRFTFQAFLEQDLVNIDEDLLERFARNPNFFEGLLSYKPDVPLTANVLKMASGDPRLMRLIMSAKGDSLVLTEDILIAAIEGPEARGVIELILNRQESVPITKNVIRAASTRGDKELLILLLKQQPESFFMDIWQETWTAVDFDSRGKMFLLLTLLEKTRSNITDAMLEQYPFDPDHAKNYDLDYLIKGLCGDDSLRRLPATERAAEIIAERFGKDAIETFLKCKKITVTDNIFQAARKNLIADQEELMAILHNVVMPLNEDQMPDNR